MKSATITLAVLGLAQAAAAQQAVTIPYQDAEAIALGEAVYADHCASCHGAGLEGEPDWRTVKENGLRPAPPHDETGHTWHHSDDQLFDLTKHGLTAVLARRGIEYESDMIGFGDVLSDEEILAALGYIKSTWPDRVIEMHDKMNASR